MCGLRATSIRTGNKIYRNQWVYSNPARCLKCHTGTSMTWEQEREAIYGDVATVEMCERDEG